MKYIEFDILKNYGYIAIQTTKNAGNMKNVQNRDNILLELKLNNKKIVNAIQTHSTNILCVDNETDITNLENIDGFITDKNDFVFLMYFADCLPIFLLDKTNNVYGLIHSGWRGSSNKILSKAINLMKEKYNCKPENILVVFGASISSRNYEIQTDTVNELAKKLDFNNMILYNNEKIYLDNKKLNYELAIREGIKEENIYSNNYCTYKNNFYSYRKDKTQDRSAAIFTRWS
ncbi:peptidoglycan editing factor PgeF [Caviibacter abscessus]|uniref:peptidoglycan editing factor PgeF n=1 Tax=Caviibacter abscessus TaxID=1766719 RepID=UPI0012E3DC73|nr:peptidoglycan editing factor PgeF [Caviibacter abscessus]